jgi:hypothetical protein
MHCIIHPKWVEKIGRLEFAWEERHQKKAPNARVAKLLSHYNTLEQRHK